MKRRIISLLLTAAVAGTLISGCGKSEPVTDVTEQETQQIVLEDTENAISEDFIVEEDTQEETVVSRSSMFTAEDTDVYSKPDENSETVESLEKGQGVTAVGEAENGWQNVETQSNKSGYVKEETLQTPEEHQAGLEEAEKEQNTKEETQDPSSAGTSGQNTGNNSNSSTSGTSGSTSSGNSQENNSASSNTTSGSNDSTSASNGSSSSNTSGGSSDTGSSQKPVFPNDGKNYVTAGDYVNGNSEWSGTTIYSPIDNGDNFTFYSLPPFDSSNETYTRIVSECTTTLSDRERTRIFNLTIDMPWEETETYAAQHTRAVAAPIVEYKYTLVDDDGNYPEETYLVTITYAQ